MVVTTGLIIAAGRGSRLDDKSGVPKPLRRVLGMPLLARILYSAARGGLKKIIIVVGFEKAKIIDYVRGRDWPVAVEFVENPKWEKSNGVSVLAAASVLRENFVLLMSDHIFDPATLKRLCEEGVHPGGAKLAVDFKLHQVFDKADATKVETVGGKIAAIGKEIVQYNAVDTGMFLMTPAIFDALEAVRKDKGDCSLTEGMQGLAAAGKAQVFDVGRGWWQDVDDATSLKVAEKTLLRACRKDTDGFVARHLNRPISLFISRRLARTPLSANQITLGVTVVGIASGVFAAGASYLDLLIAALLFKAASILDGVDGEIAKLKYTASKMGAWLDTLGDNLTYVTFFTGLTIGTWRRGLIPDWFVWLPLTGIVLIMIVMFTHLIRNTNEGSLLAIQAQVQARKDASLFARILAKLQLIMKRDSFALIFLILALLDLPQVILVLVTLFAHGGWMAVAARMRKVS